MEREIQFRGKRWNGKWVYGSLVMSENLNPAIYYEEGKGLAKWFEWCYVNTDTICQYTGLKDKNGKEIYEGDIVTISNNLKAVVIWFNGSFRFKDELSCKATYFDDIGIVIRDYDVCIIGNIHDNPELIK